MIPSPLPTARLSLRALCSDGSSRRLLALLQSLRMSLLALGRGPPRSATRLAPLRPCSTCSAYHTDTLCKFSSGIGAARRVDRRGASSACAACDGAPASCSSSSRSPSSVKPDTSDAGPVEAPLTSGRVALCGPGHGWRRHGTRDDPGLGCARRSSCAPSTLVEDRSAQGSLETPRRVNLFAALTRRAVGAPA